MFKCDELRNYENMRNTRILSKIKYLKLIGCLVLLFTICIGVAAEDQEEPSIYNKSLYETLETWNPGVFTVLVDNLQGLIHSSSLEIFVNTLYNIFILSIKYVLKSPL